MLFNFSKLWKKKIPEVVPVSEIKPEKPNACTYFKSGFSCSQLHTSSRMEKDAICLACGGKVKSCVIKYTYDYEWNDRFGWWQETPLVSSFNYWLS